MKYKKESLFWNDKQNIKWFNDYPASNYWVKFLKTIKNKSQKKVLDLGCGAGRHTKLLNELGFDVYACDQYIGMVKKTKEGMLSAKWFNKKLKERITKQSMNNLSYPSNFFDIVMCHGVYHNAFGLKIFKKSISESSRVLKKEGKLLFNIFTNELLSKDLKFINKKNSLYLTKENLRIVLISPDTFLELASQEKLTPVNKKDLVLYHSNVSTGARAVFRGILLKK